MRGAGGGAGVCWQAAPIATVSSAKYERKGEIPRGTECLKSDKQGAIWQERPVERVILNG